MRIGNFILSQRFIEERPETARVIMGHCIVVRCEMMYYSGNFHYTAISPHFDEVGHGAVPSDYAIRIGTEFADVKFEREK